ncbi:DUF2062 domain-containing protein [Sphingomonas ginkgonis]|uniref:DUF2062 domain-containing protein n=1 Tax=Sphingomonas ginkgonis TaxID=2315330 RepID=UPI00163B1BC5|nr:DUF2062 domain-containing protein [Sphingomonas ginkgonis]
MSVLAAGTKFVRRHLPRRETIHQYRLLRPFARHLSHPALWRLNRRSVPRGVAIGLGIGIIIPFMHTVVAALIALPARANIAVAAAFTLLVNPLTIPPLYYAAYRVGRWELHTDVIVDPAQVDRLGSELSRFLFWLHAASGPIALGILTISLGAALFGYAGSKLVYRQLVRRRWRERRLSRRGPFVDA